jgi:cysteine desulfurase
MQVYMDNAATTPLDKEVFEAMTPYMLEHFGNPSSIHAHGRQVRAAIERARKTIATLLHASPAEIFFTSGGTEADNAALFGTIRSGPIRHVISSPLEHHAVLHSLETMEKNGEIELAFVRHDERGGLDLEHLGSLLAARPQSLVSLMHANNEIGNLNDIARIGDICRSYNAIFHSDTVQTMGHYRHDLQQLHLHLLVGSAHKFHGPKGVGFIYINGAVKVPPLIYGGAQERNMRGGTENVYGIVGLAKALEIAYREMDKHQAYIQGLKDRLIYKLTEQIPGVSFNGYSAEADKSLYTVLNVSLPPSPVHEMLLFKLDINKISVSGGSACTSGSNIGSHVLEAIHTDPDRGAVRLSLSKFNTADEVDYVVDVLSKLFQPVAR